VRRLIVSAIFIWLWNHNRMSLLWVMPLLNWLHLLQSQCSAITASCLIIH